MNVFIADYPNRSMRGARVVALLLLLLLFAIPMMHAQVPQYNAPASATNLFPVDYQPPECTALNSVSFSSIAIGNLNNPNNPDGNPFDVALLALTISIDAIAPGNIPSTPTTAGMVIPGVNLDAINHASNTYLCNVANYLVGSWSMAGDMFLGLGYIRGLAIGYYLGLPIPDPAGGGQSILFGVSYGAYQNLMLETGQFIIAPYQSIVNDYLQFLLFPASIIITSEIELVPVLMFLGLSLFIPVGLVFRAFPFVRGIGGTMIGIGIGFAIIWPTILIGFNYPITNALNNDLPLPEWSVTNPAYPPNLAAIPYAGSFSAPTGIEPKNVAGCTLITSDVAGALFGSNWLGSIIGSFTGFICERFNHIVIDTLTISATSPQDSATLASNYNSAAAFGFEAFTSATFFLNYLMIYGVYVIVQLLLFVFDLVIFYSATDNFARTLGGTIRFELGGKLRLAS